MPTAKGTWTKMGDELVHKRGDIIGYFLRGGPRENYPCILIQPIFLNFLLIYEPSNFLLSIPKANH